jgi:hypothetical protein
MSKTIRKIIPGHLEFTDICLEKWEKAMSLVRQGKYPPKNPSVMSFVVSDEVWREWWDQEADNYVKDKAKVQFRGAVIRIPRRTYDRLRLRASDWGTTPEQFWNTAAIKWLEYEYNLDFD